MVDQATNRLQKADVLLMLSSTVATQRARYDRFTNERGRKSAEPLTGVSTEIKSKATTRSRFSTTVAVYTVLSVSFHDMLLWSQ
jgi:hypothetical protein